MLNTPFPQPKISWVQGANSPAGKKIIGAIDDAARPVQQGLVGAAGKVPVGMGRQAATRMAGGALGKGIARAVPVLSSGLAVMDVADLVTGDESFANKAMDATAMTIGGVLGSVGGPLGTAAGISTGKFLSDGTQWLFGDRKTPEQRKMEEALRALQQRGIILMSTQHELLSTDYSLQTNAGL